MKSLRGLISFSLQTLLLLISSLAVQAQENELSKSDRAKKMATRVDELLNQKLTELGWQPAGRCDDASYLRRASLDLAGTVPTGREVLDFISNPSATKRNDLVARLLASPTSSTHLANTWSNWLLPEANSPEVQFGRAGVQTWLRSRFAETCATIALSPTCWYRPARSKTAPPHSSWLWKASPKRSPPKRLASSWAFNSTAPNATTIRSIIGSRLTSGALLPTSRSFQPMTNR